MRYPEIKVINPQELPESIKWLKILILLYRNVQVASSKIYDGESQNHATDYSGPAFLNPESINWLFH